MNTGNIKSFLKNIPALFGRGVKRLKKIKGADAAVIAVVTALSCLVILPSIGQCIINRSKAACTTHMARMINILAGELNRETEKGGTYWHDLILNGNYSKLLNSLSDKTGEGYKFPASDYYIRTGDEKILIACKKHKDVEEKEIRFSSMYNENIEVAEKPMIGEKIIYITVTGPDTYYENDTLDPNDPQKMVFTGREVDSALQNLKVSAVYPGGHKEELPRSRYTVTAASALDMKKPGITRLIVKSDSTSVWDNSVYAPFMIDIIGSDDVAPLIVDGGINGRYSLASWEWSDYLEEASEQKEGKEFDASIILYAGKYYYYPDGMYIDNSKKNENPLRFALDIADHEKTAYYIPFDTDSVILTSADEDKIHNGSLKVENELVYIWQDEASKELPAGWIRVYCELKKY